MKAFFKLSFLLCILISSCKKEINEVVLFFGFNTVLQAISNGQGRRISGDSCLIPTDGSGLQ
jgi:UDP-N-acetyl-D-mannosaminuronic acid transferase (WecB/TagA/CpsF family)